MNEIEEIKERVASAYFEREEKEMNYPPYGKQIIEKYNIGQAIKDIQILLSSLEKEEQAHTMSIFDLNMKIAEAGIALEKKKEQSDYFRFGTNKLTDELAKEKESHIDAIERLEEAAGKHLNNLMKISILESRLKKLVEAVEAIYHEADGCTRQSWITVREICKKVLGEMKSDLKDYTSPNVIELLSLVEQLTKRIKELESQLASIKADESIGKLEVVGNFGEDE